MYNSNKIIIIIVLRMMIIIIIVVVIITIIVIRIIIVVIIVRISIVAIMLAEGAEDGHGVGPEVAAQLHEDPRRVVVRLVCKGNQGELRGSQGMGVISNS